LDVPPNKDTKNLYCPPVHFILSQYYQGSLAQLKPHKKFILSTCPFHP